MWLISLGLHGLLLMVPLPDYPLSESPKPLREVKITDLPASPQGSTSKSSESSAKVSKPTSSDTSIPRQDIEIRPRLPKPTPSATPTPKPTPSATPTPPKPVTTPTATPGVKVEGGELEKFLGELTASSEMPPDEASKLSPDLFAEPRLFFDQLGSSSEPKPKSGILKMVRIDGKKPDQVQVQVLNSQRSGKNFQVSELGNYGEGKVYKVQQESKVWYFNLILTKGSSGTVVVVWKRDPSQAQ